MCRTAEFFLRGASGSSRQRIASFISILCQVKESLEESRTRLRTGRAKFFESRRPLESGWKAGSLASKAWVRPTRSAADAGRRQEPGSAKDKKQSRNAPCIQTLGSGVRYGPGFSSSRPRLQTSRPVTSICSVRCWPVARQDLSTASLIRSAVYCDRTGLLRYRMSWARVQVAPVS